jgi:hypothetical protein
MKQYLCLIFWCIYADLSLAQNELSGREFILEFQPNQFYDLSSLRAAGTENQFSWALNSLISFPIGTHSRLQTGVSLLAARQTLNNLFLDNVVIPDPRIPTSYIRDRQSYFLTIPTNLVWKFGLKRRLFLTGGGGPLLFLRENVNTESIYKDESILNTRIITRFPNGIRIGWQLNAGFGYQVPLTGHWQMRLQPVVTFMRPELRGNQAYAFVGINLGIIWGSIGRKGK